MLAKERVASAGVISGHKTIKINVWKNSVSIILTFGHPANIATAILTLSTTTGSDTGKPIRAQIISYSCNTNNITCIAYYDTVSSTNVVEVSANNLNYGAISAFSLSIGGIRGFKTIQSTEYSSSTCTNRIEVPVKEFFAL